MKDSTLWLVIVMSSFLLCGRGGCNSQQLKNPIIARNWEMFTLEMLEQLPEEARGIIDRIRSFLHRVLEAVKSSSFPTAVAKNVSQLCKQDSQDYVHSLYSFNSLWALQMKESTGQLPPGMFGAANYHADGLFDECLAVRSPNFDGQYCTVFLNPQFVDESEITYQTTEKNARNNNLITITQFLGFLGQLAGSGRVKPKVSGADSYTYALPSVSFCLPSSCSAADLGQSVAELVGSYVFLNNTSIVTIADEQYCFKDNVEPVKLDGPDITVIVVLSLIGILVFLATIHEGWRMYCGAEFDANTDGVAVSALHCFSALTNGRKVLSYKDLSSTDNNLACVHGLRFLSTCWLVVEHSWIVGVIFKSMNPKTAKLGGLHKPIPNGSIAVDTFFILSGLLVSYNLLRKLERNKGKLNAGLFYLHRYMRLTPVYALVLGFVATLMVYVGTGPNWYSVILASDACRVVWWRHFLYITNFFPSDPNYQLCMHQTWYLSVDMQLFLVSPIFIYPLWRWRKYGLVWLAFISLASQAAVFAVYAVNDLIPSTISHQLSDSGPYYIHYYDKPWFRAPSYLVGIWAGWCLHVTKQSPVRLSKLFVALGWVVAIAVGLFAIYGLSPYVKEGKLTEIDPVFKMIYGPFHRTAWAMVVAWIVFSCSSGYGGIVNRSLSWKGYLPLGRLTFCVYLIHQDYINVYYSALRKNYYYTGLVVFTTNFGVVATCFSLALVAYVTLEASFINLLKLSFSKQKK